MMEGSSQSSDHGEALLEEQQEGAEGLPQGAEALDETLAAAMHDLQLDDDDQVAVHPRRFQHLSDWQENWLWFQGRRSLPVSFRIGDESEWDDSSSTWSSTAWRSERVTPLPSDHPSPELLPPAASPASSPPPPYETYETPTETPPPEYEEELPAIPPPVSCSVYGEVFEVDSEQEDQTLLNRWWKRFCCCHV